MRIMTWNVNGIKTLLQYSPWNTLKTYENILNELGADIVCFQETKITKKQVERSMAILPSYDSFFSSYSRKPERGYSGTCIFTNRSTCVPVRAEEGLSGLLPVEQQRGTRSGEKAEGFIEGALSNETIALNMADVKTIDLEGRTTMVDMGLFVLINMYCPNETNEERLDFKLAFNAMMEARILGLISAGREVIAVGDFNICAKVIDHCDPVKRANDHPAYGAFENHPARKWFNQFVTSDPAKELFSNGGTARMVDLGRYFYPDRKGMFSHWETRINARETNYGTRLDYIICTPGLLPWVKTCEVQNSILGSDHCPVVADFHDSITDAEGTVHGLWEAINPPGRKSGEEVEPPRLAARNYPEFGKEQKLLSTFFGKKSAKAESPVVSEPAATTSTSSAVPLSSPIALSTHASETALETAQAASSSNVNGVSALPSRPPLVPSHSSSTISQQASKSAQSVPQSPSIDLTLHDEEEEGEEQEVVAGPSRSRQPDASASTSKRKREKEPLVSRSPSVSISSNERRESSLVPSVGKKKTKGQQTIASFFKPPAPPASSSTEMKKDRKGKGKAKTQEEDASVGATTSGENRVEGVALSSNSSKETEDDDELQVVEGSTPSAENVNGKPKKRDSAVAPVKYTDEDIDEEDEDDIRMAVDSSLSSKNSINNAQASSAWSSIFSAKVPPLCSGHQEPTKQWTVNKSGINKGRVFWLCQRPIGEGYDKGQSRDKVNPEFRCDYFKWESDVKRGSDSPEKDTARYYGNGWKKQRAMPHGQG